MRPSSANNIRKLLLKGHTPREAAALLSCSPRWVRMVAARNRLPTNAPIPKGSRREAQILKALVLYDMNVDHVATMFSQTPSRVKSLISNLRAT